MVGLEGTRSYGAGLCRALQDVGIGVVEVERPSRGERGRRGKSDAGDAELAARKVLAMPTDRLPEPRSADGEREALRLLTIGRESMTKHRTQLVNQLLSTLLTGTPAQQALRKKDLTVATLRGLVKSRAGKNTGIAEQTRSAELRRIAAAVLDLDSQLRDNDQRLKQIIEQIAPQLLELIGVGPVGAAQAIVTYSHHGRCRDEATFAALAGASPVPASSGRINRYRLNRGGDRRLNRTLHVIAVTRARYDPRTQAYIQRRSKDMNDKEIRRVLKRYIARELFKVLRTIDALKPTSPAAVTTTAG